MGMPEVETMKPILEVLFPLLDNFRHIQAPLLGRSGTVLYISLPIRFFDDERS